MHEEIALPIWSVLYFEWQYTHCNYLFYGKDWLDMRGMIYYSKKKILYHLSLSAAKQIQLIPHNNASKVE